MELPASGSTPPGGEFSELVAILEATLSPSTQIVTQAQGQLEVAAQANLELFLSTLANVLANVNNSDTSRAAAGLQLKNYLTSKDPGEKVMKQQRWFNFTSETKLTIRQLALASLGTENNGPKSAAQCVAYIAGVEHVYNNWPELVPQLMKNVTSSESTPQLKEASLEAIGYICEDLDPKYLVHQSNEILTAVIQGMREDQQSTGVRLAATKALFNTLEIAKANFEKESERHYIMQVLCEATQCKDMRVQVAALQNMVKIMSLYYQYMESYMGPALFAITLEAMKSDSDDVSLQGIEFWSTVCDEEADLAIEAAEALENGHPPELTSRFYVKGAMDYLVPVLLLTLAKQDEGDDEDEWNPCKAAGVCLSLMAGCCEGTILKPVIQFVDAQIISTDWKFRDAAVMAIGSVLEGAEADDLESKVKHLVEPLVTLMQDESVQVRDSVAWTIGRMCEHCPGALLQEKYLLTLLQSLIHLLDAEVRVAVNVCWAFSALVEAAYESAVVTSSSDIPAACCLSPHYVIIASKLLETSDRSDSSSGNLRNAAYEALMDFIKNSPEDVYSAIQQVAVEITSRLYNGVTVFQVATGSQKQQLTEVLCLLLATVQSLIRRLSPEDVGTISDQVVANLLKLNESEGVQEDVMMTMGVLIDVLGGSFIKYMEAFYPVLLKGIGNIADVQVSSASIGLVGDLCRNLSSTILPLCGNLMQVLITVLQSANADKSLKPPILSAFGDLAMAIGLEFAPYLEVVLSVLSQAMLFSHDKSDYDIIEYGNELRDSCLEAFTGIVQGLKDSKEDTTNRDKVFTLMTSQLPPIITYIVAMAVDDDKSDSNLSNSLGLLGDLCSVFGGHISLNAAMQDALMKLVAEGKKSRTKRTRLLADWAHKELKTAIQRQASVVK